MNTRTNKEEGFSVIIPLYNKVNYVMKSIQSVLEQTYKQIEIIIINDGSSDGSEKLLKKITDHPRIRVFHQSNQGVSVARNNGIKAATYDRIAFLDADDWWDKDYLLKIDQLIHIYPDAAVYSTTHAIVTKNKTSPCRYFKDSIPHITYDLFEFSLTQKKSDLPLNASNCVTHQNVLDQAGLFDEKISFYEDYDLFFRLGLVGRGAYLNSPPLSFYNHKIPLNERANGQLPTIESHLVSHLHKFDPYINLHPNLLKCLNQFKLNSLLMYLEKGIEFEKITILLKNIPKKEYTLRHKIFFLSKPVSFIAIKSKPLIFFLKSIL